MKNQNGDDRGVRQNHVLMSGEQETFAALSGPGVIVHRIFGLVNRLKSNCGLKCHAFTIRAERCIHSDKFGIPHRDGWFALMSS